MGHSHGIVWTAEMIKTEILKTKDILKISSMPTHAQMNEATGSNALSNAVSRHGGSAYWAEELGLEIKPCESKTGFEFECKCLDYLKSLGYECSLTKARYPYDIIANGNVKIDVKVSNTFNGKNGDYFTFNLEKAMPTCDIYVCYCVDSGALKKVYVIPSCILSGKTQLSIGKVKSKYDTYIDNWEIVEKYNSFYLKLA